MNMIARAVKSNAITPFINFLSGVLLKFSNPFKKGDFIEIDGQLGSVKERGFKKTVITNLDGSVTIIENGKFYKGDLHNLSSKNIIRLAFSINLCYTTDMGRAKEAITKYLLADEKVLKTPSPKLQVIKLKEKYVEISIQPWCLLDHYMELDQKLEENLKHELTGLGFLVKMEGTQFETLGVTA